MLEPSAEAPRFDEHLHHRECVVQHELIPLNELGNPVLHDQHHELESTSVRLIIEKADHLSVENLVEDYTDVLDRWEVLRKSQRQYMGEELNLVCVILNVRV